MLGTFGGMKVTVSKHAVERTENWPVLKRSKRLHKKLTKKRGPQFSETPCALQTPFGLVVHPEIYELLKSKQEQNHG